MNIIQTLMLVALGFLSASLLSLIFSRAVWRRAVRLTSKRLRAELPASWRDVQADRDQLRAEYAIETRQLEIRLDQAREKSVQQMVAVNRHKAALKEQQDQIRSLRSSLAERSSKTTVLEQTVRQRLPELMGRLDTATNNVNERDQRISKLRRGIEKQTAALNQASQTERLRQAEIQRLRQALDAASRNQGARAASQKEFRTLRAQNKRLVQAVEVLKKELTAAKQFEVQQAPMLREEMARLGDTMVRMATTAQKGAILASPAAHKAEAKRIKLSEKHRADAQKTGSKKDTDPQKDKRKTDTPKAVGPDAKKKAGPLGNRSKAAPLSKKSDEKAPKAPKVPDMNVADLKAAASKALSSSSSSSAAMPRAGSGKTGATAKLPSTNDLLGLRDKKDNRTDKPGSSSKAAKDPRHQPPSASRSRAAGSKTKNGAGGAEAKNPAQEQNKAAGASTKKVSLADRLRKVKERQAE